MKGLRERLTQDAAQSARVGGPSRLSSDGVGRGLQSGPPSPSWPTRNAGLPGPTGLAGDSALDTADDTPADKEPIEPGSYELNTWLRRAIAMAMASATATTIRRATASAPIGRRAMFVLVRWAKGHPELLHARGAQAWAALTDASPVWLTTFIEVVAVRSGRSADKVNADEVRETFEACWNAVQIPIGWDAITVALRQARQCPLDLDHLFARDRRPLRDATSALGWLQAYQPESPICFSRVPWSRHLGLSPRAITDLAQAMLHADILRELRRGHWERGHSIDYRFNVGAFPPLHAGLTPSELTEAGAAFARLPRYERQEKPRVRARGRLIAAASQHLGATTEPPLGSPSGARLDEPI